MDISSSRFLIIDVDSFGQQSSTTLDRIVTALGRAELELWEEQV
jgi:hypothetical protein